MILQQRTKVLESTDMGKYKKILLYSIVFGNDMVWEGKTKYWPVNTIINLYPSLNVTINSECLEWPCVRRRHGDLTGIKIRDKDSMLAAVGEMAFYWLLHTTGLELRLPTIGWKVVGDQTRDTCRECRYCSHVRMGSDEFDMDFSDDSGTCQRDLPKGRKHGPDWVIPPTHLCQLFGFYLEEEFGLLAPLNQMAEGGMVKGNMINMGAGYGLDNWVMINDYISRRIEDLSCPWHRQRDFSFGGSNIQDTMGEKGPYAKKSTLGKGYHDIVPPGWLPRTDRGILVPGGIELWNEKIALSALQEPTLEQRPLEAQKGGTDIVQSRMQAGQGQHEELGVSGIPTGA